MKKNCLSCGIINVTTDSFFAPSRVDPESAAERAVTLVEQGADMLDIGAVSTAPGVTIADEKTELERLKLALPKIRAAVNVPLCVDTFRVDVARAAIGMGADIINDTGGVPSRSMAELISQSSCGWIIMHTGGLTSSEENNYSGGILSALEQFFRSARSLAESFGIDSDRLIFDPGIGFGKSREDDLAIISHFGDIDFCGCRSMAALSQKRVTRLCGDAFTGTTVYDAVCVLGGADIIRVHDVSAASAAVKALSLLY